ncbi:MAG TPA: adenylate/guanylate cyclase domain-containing protein, partial [Actinomycetota bacterium]
MRTCPNCGAENSERSRFCMACGTPLDAPIPAEERRLVTVLFADIAGFTERFERADPEDVGAVLQSFHARSRQEIEGFGGTVDKVAGDVVFGLFGAPTTHEDDAERALRAALNIMQRTHDADEDDMARVLGVRIGIATGEAMVSVGEGPRVGERVTGDVVNLASRLCSAAAPGCIVVAESTFLGTRSQFRWEDLGAIEVRGKTDPVRIWRPIEPLARVGVEPPDPLGAPFTGRGMELDDLRRVFEHTRRDRHPAMVTIIGEPGLGKSRLIAELSRFTDDLPDLIRWRVGRPSAYGQVTTFGPLADIVKAEAGVLHSDDTDIALAKLDEVVERVMDDPSERSRVRGHLSSLLVGSDVAGEVSLDEAFSAWASFLEALAAENTTVLVLEDMHDALDPLLGFLERLLERDRSVPMLVIVAARPELLERYPGWGVGPAAALVRLAPLSRDDTTRLVRSLLGSQPLPAETRDAVVRRAGGNPLYAEEFIRTMQERFDGSDLMGDPGQPVHAVLSLPPSIHALLASRLDALPAELRSTVQDASVVGAVVWAGAIAHVDGRPRAQVVRHLEELVERQLLRRVRTSSIKDQEEFTFRHVLVREVAYGQIPRAERARKHAAVAEWIG